MRHLLLLMSSESGSNVTMHLHHPSHSCSYHMLSFLRLHHYLLMHSSYDLCCLAHQFRPVWLPLHFLMIFHLRCWLLCLHTLLVIATRKVWAHCVLPRINIHFESPSLISNNYAYKLSIDKDNFDYRVVRSTHMRKFSMSSKSTMIKSQTQGCDLLGMTSRWGLVAHIIK